MKKYRLKKATTNLLILIEIFLFFMLGSDSNSITIFIVSKIINFSLFIIIALILNKYGYKKI